MGPPGTLQPGFDGYLFGSMIIPVIGPRILYANGRGGELLSLFDQTFADHPGGWRDMINAPGSVLQGTGPHPAAPYIAMAMAMRDAGRDSDAAEMLRLNIQQLEPGSDGMIGVSDLTLLARLAAVDGDGERAITLLEQARAAGWPATIHLEEFDVLQGPLSADPAFASLRGGLRFEAISDAIETERAREREKAAALGL